MAATPYPNIDPSAAADIPRLFEVLPGLDVTVAPHWDDGTQ